MAFINVSLANFCANISSDNSTFSSSNRGIIQSSTMFALGVFGNSLALMLMATTSPEKRRTLFYKLMFALALTDLLGTCATSPVVVHVKVTGKSLQSDTLMCQYFAFMLVFAAFATMSLVCAMAVERYLKLCKPMFHQCYLPTTYARYAIIASWGFSVIMAALPIVGLGRYTSHFPCTWCFLEVASPQVQNRFYGVLFAIATLAALALTFGCNASAIYAVKALRSRTIEFKRSRSLSLRFAELQMLVILIGVTIIFTTCFAPIMVFTLVSETGTLDPDVVERSYLLMIYLASFNPILDPWVFILVRREFRWKIIVTCKRMLGLHRPMSPGSDLGDRFWTPRPSIPDTAVVACDSPNGAVGEEPVMSAWTFCVRCLCDPPPPERRPSYCDSMFAQGRSPNHLPPELLRRISHENVLNGKRTQAPLLQNMKTRLQKLPQPLETTAT